GGGTKPTNLTNNPTQKHFIQNKYKHHKYYNTTTFNNLPTPSPTTNHTNTNTPSNTIKPPSKTTQQHIKTHHLKKSQSTFT
ncbi:hypothetical protein, partial [Proteus mirabilis]|uniref:hypothetical protein n=1 Tax=Proteus mirabilis TaxID=584 RepID=UPI002578EA5B